jgi:hypothetical protein
MYSPDQRPRSRYFCRLPFSMQAERPLSLTTTRISRTQAGHLRGRFDVGASSVQAWRLVLCPWLPASVAARAFIPMRIIPLMPVALMLQELDRRERNRPHVVVWRLSRPSLAAYLFVVAVIGRLCSQRGTQHG